ncbi:succinate dehydrogenase, hydrophobic membrane anchor protein [Nioella nitratireducens]|uniref:succinate dehydrogenase, hydrophobic membrane anchor protein n=1 Tax=Nioella nitratireducens TaxID=1287720 RepID=UPI0008FD8741|nr:succinate dehydrogenase, hydrophobic membrane anchor protein [Nioella nitratireducens]
MAFMTDRKRVIGLGSAKSGTDHFWKTTVTSVALLVVVPMFLFTFGPLLGAPYEEVIATLSRPFPAVSAALMLIAGFYHFRLGIQMVIEDYMEGLSRKVAIVVMACVSYGLMALGLVSLAQIAL